MEVGDYVECREVEDMVTYGYIIAIEDPVEGVSDEEADLAVKWIEVYASHRLWGGSNAMRGLEHVDPMSALKPATGQGLRIAREGKESYTRAPERWDKKREAIENKINAASN